jgi:predicted TIM-barrel fold metal-dependent hydrolase
MNRRQLFLLPTSAFALRPGFLQAQSPKTAEPGPAEAEGVLPDKLLLKDYRPKSIYRIPVSDIGKARYPIIDTHYHGRARTPEDVDREVKLMDSAGVERTIVFAGTGARFDEYYRLYSHYPKRFDIWCGFDFRDSDKPEYGPDAVKELERCHTAGARGVGEIIDKGRGFGRRSPSAQGPHADDPRMDSLFEKCADLGMPVNIHVSDPIWGYLKQDFTNDGLMNGFKWRLDNQTGIMGHDDLLASLEGAAKKHKRTIFIASHLANLDYDLNRLGGMFDRNPNLYADISARFAEISPVPRFTSRFFGRYAHRIVYGTDMTYNQRMFSNTFRILESLDEHFYDNYQYHWPLHGLGLPDEVLRKVYRETAIEAFNHARNNARV